MSVDVGLPTARIVLRKGAAMEALFLSETKAVLSTEMRNALPDSAFACITGSGDSKQRKYPHHHADGSIDLPHLRNALSRLAQDDTTSCGAGHLRAHAKAEGIGQENKHMDMALKWAGPDTIEGLAIPFGGPEDRDTDGEYFTKDTDLCIEWFGKSGRPILYDHGTDKSVGPAVIGRQTEYEIRDEGVWAQAQLNRNARYRKAIDSLIEQGALGYSSGAMAHLVTKNASGLLTRWPWVELSPTPIPSHPGTLGIHYVKSSDLIAHMQAVEVEIPDPLKAALTALDEWADSRDESLPAGVKFADHADRLLDDVSAFRDRVSGLGELRGKAGRVLSAATRERLASHPVALRQLADDLDELLASTDAGKSALISAILAAEVARARRFVSEGEPS
jgi:hypothetical protein